jgi:hypothetical protein
VLLCVDLPGEIPEPAQWEELLDALDAVSPLIDDVRSGLAYLDMHGRKRERCSRRTAACRVSALD